MTEIEKTSVMGTGVEYNKNSLSVPDTGLAISLPQIISKINTKDEEFLKYIPDKMLTVKQKEAKQKAIKNNKNVNKELGIIDEH